MVCIIKISKSFTAESPFNLKINDSNSWGNKMEHTCILMSQDSSLIVFTDAMQSAQGLNPVDGTFKPYMYAVSYRYLEKKKQNSRIKNELD